MTQTQRDASLIDLGSATDMTRGAVPGRTPDGIQPLQYPNFGLSAD